MVDLSVLTGDMANVETKYSDVFDPYAEINTDVDIFLFPTLAHISIQATEFFSITFWYYERESGRDV